MAFKMKGFSPFTKIDDKVSITEVRDALEDWKKSEHDSEDYRINQLKDEGGSRKIFRNLNSITKRKRRIYEILKKKSDFKPNIIKNK